MKRVITATFLLSLFVIGAHAQQSDDMLTNTSVIKLVKAGFKEKTVISIIHNRPSTFKLDTEQLIELSEGVSENIILAMLASQAGTFVVSDDEWNDEAFFKGVNKNQNGGEPQATG